MLQDLAERYAGYLVDDDRGDRDLALSTSTPVLEAGSRLLPTLLHGRRPLLRSRSLERLLDRLDLELGAVAIEPRTDVIPVRGFGAVIRDGSAALVPAPLFDLASAFERRVRHLGCEVAEPTGLSIDVAHGRLRVCAPLTEVGTHQPGGAGDHLLAAICWDSAMVPVDERLATALVRLLGHLDPVDLRQLRTSLPALRDLVAQTATSVRVRPDVAADLTAVDRLLRDVSHQPS